MTIVTSIQGETLDRLCYRHYRTNTMLERVIEENPDIDTSKVILAENTPVFMPEIQARITRTRLWGKGA